MPRLDLVVSSAVVRSARVLQLEGLFDVPAASHSTQEWHADLPLDARPWRIGAIVGPSGAGKSSVARALFQDALVPTYDWLPDRSIVDAFPRACSIRDITMLLSSVGFSSPPAWLRPFSVLSTGQQFRVMLARALAEAPADGLIVMDEFTSVVDRTVAQIGSAALAKTIRRSVGQRFVAVTCHYDVLDWLQPDWIFEPHLGRFQWRALQRRPALELRIQRSSGALWPLFRQHHYLSGALHRAARCFLGTWRDTPVTFTAVLPSAGFVGKWREHRTVCLPDFQGVGFGNAMSAAVAAIVRSVTNGEYRSVTSHPALMQSRAASTLWRLEQQPSMSARPRQRSMPGGRMRLAATFRYVGPDWADRDMARLLWSESISAKAMIQTRASEGSA